MKHYLELERALKKAWGKDTAYRKDAEHWTPENPACGQCAITALLFNELYGGTIHSGVSNTGIYHYWNKKDGVKYDFTERQFPTKLHFKNVKIWNREDVLASGNVAERYELLRSRAFAELHKK